jgi:putative DNA methylase
MFTVPSKPYKKLSRNHERTVKDPAPRTALEEGLPLYELNELALLESYNKANYRPSNYVHKWWARRPGSVFRMITLAALSPPGTGLWKEYYRPQDFKGKVVFDPFMGGGTTLIEARRMGCRVIGSDINPVAWFIVKKAIEKVDLEKLDQAMDQIDRRVAPALSPMYTTLCSVCSSRSPVMFYLWVKVANCSSCGAEMHLNSSPVVRYNSEKQGVILCPHCKLVFEGHVGKTICPQCKKEFDSREEIARKGKVTCLSCGKRNVIAELIRHRSEPLPDELFCIAYRCRRHRQRFKAPDEHDMESYNRAVAEYDKRRDELLQPLQEIPDGLKTGDLLTYKYHHWNELFNPRQIVALDVILRAVMDIGDWNVREFMLTVFSSSLEFYSMFCGYKGGHVRRPGAVRHTFAHHAFVYPLEPLENNIWGEERDSGTFKYLFRNRLFRAKEFGQAPVERRIYDGKVGEIVAIPGESATASVAEVLSEFLKGEADALVMCRDSAAFKLPEGSVDVVITDPPYFDNVQYSELSDFFYVWLRLALEKHYPQFAPELVGKSKEVVGNVVAEKHPEFFEEGLASVFRRAHKSLKNDGLLVFTFHHKETNAWIYTLRAILKSGFFVAKTYPVHSEMRVSVHIVGQEAVTYDTVIVCKKREDTAIASWEELLPLVRRESEEVLRIFDGTEFYKINKEVVVFGKCMEQYSKHYPNVFSAKEKVSPEEAIRSTIPIVEELESKLALRPPAGRRIKRIDDFGSN